MRYYDRLIVAINSIIYRFTGWMKSTSWRDGRCFMIDRWLLCFCDFHEPGLLWFDTNRLLISFVQSLFLILLHTGNEFFVGISNYTNEGGAKAVAAAFPEYPCVPIKVGNWRGKSLPIFSLSLSFSLLYRPIPRHDLNSFLTSFQYTLTHTHTRPGWGWIWLPFANPLFGFLQRNYSGLICSCLLIYL